MTAQMQRLQDGTKIPGELRQLAEWFPNVRSAMLELSSLTSSASSEPFHSLFFKYLLLTGEP
eukprot:SAG11_NODE_386_length_9887_cov_3.904986_6_plen_62_part_00